MARVRQWLLIVLSLILGGQIIRAADSEDRAFSSASSTFSLNIWDQAEKQFADFVKQFPNSPRVAEAILYEGEAMYMQTNFFKAIELLSDHQNAAGKWSELYLYWTAQAELQHGDYPAAADAFGRLITLFPNSPNRLSACVGQAAALARAGEWERARHVLEKPDSVFQQVAKTNASEVAVQGRLLLGEAQLTGEDYPGLEGTLGVLSALNVNAELAWRREYLRCRLQIARDKLDDALQTATNLIALAGAASASQAEGRIVTPEARVGSAYGVVPPAAFWAEAMSLQAGIEERMNDLDKAITTYQQLIDNTNTPAAQLRHALFKTASLMESDDATNAMEKLQQFLNKFPNSPAADMALLTLGELKFKQYLAWSATNTSPTAVTGTNLLEDALDRFNHLSETFTNSPLVGKALLDKGWCLWSASSNNLWPAGSSNALVKCEEAFRAATGRLSSPEDQAVARFKLADAQFRLNNFTRALTNYNLLITRYASVPEVREQYLEQALYQTVRAALDAGDMSSATNALQKILDWYPNGNAGDSCLLLTGQGFAQQNDPARARALFTEFEQRYPQSPLLPEVRLAVASSYEQQGMYNLAAKEYAQWATTITNRDQLSRAKFSEALDTYRAGQETNALNLFTNFLAQFPTNPLAQRAQFWVGDYYFRQAKYQLAELNYQLVFNTTNWPKSELTYQAQMMAGRAAMARLSASQAIRLYFEPLAEDTNCQPASLGTEARLAWASALETRDSTNKPLDLTNAIAVLNDIPSTNHLWPSALGEIANCYLQLGAADTNQALMHYEACSNAFERLANLAGASVAARNQARVGLGIVAEAEAQLKTGDDQTALLGQALANYLAVFNDNEADPITWRKEAGLKTELLLEKMQRWDEAKRVCEKLQQLYPVLSASLEKRISRLNAR